MNANKKIALVTGANRGLGLGVAEELARQRMHVILTSRGEKGKLKADELQAKGLDVEFRKLDLADEKSIQALFEGIQKDHGRVDVLINNGAILLDREQKADQKILQETLNTNAIGSYLMIDKFLPLMIQNRYGRIVNVSSGMGQLSAMSSDFPAYRISKAALNAVTLIFNAQKQIPEILINSVCPGWVKTDMGTDAAPLPLEAGVKSIVWGATLPPEGPSGGFFRHGKRLEW